MACGLEEVEFSVPRGVFEDSFTLHLHTDEPGAEIRYTTDFSKPGITSPLYSGPIRIAGNTTVRAVVTVNGELGPAVSHTYLFPAQVWQQPKMSAHVADNPQYADRLIPALLELPSISIVSDAYGPDDFVDVITEMSAEMIFPDGQKGWMEQCGVKGWGGSPQNPKKQYRFEFKSEYGTPKLHYRGLFDDGVEHGIPCVDTFDHIILRGGSQDGLNGEFNNENHGTFIRNRVAFDMEMEAGNPSGHGRFVHVYFNHQYNGMFHMLERVNAGFMEEYFGYDKEDYDVIKDADVIDGEDSQSNLPPFLWEMWDVVETEAANGFAGYRKISDYVDYGNVANNAVLHGFVGSGDTGGNHNVLHAANRTPGKGGWKYFMWDRDRGFANPFTGPIEPQRISIGSPAAISDLDLVPEMEHHYGDAVHNVLLRDDAPCSAERARELWTQRANQVRLPLVAESARWGAHDFQGSPQVPVTNWHVDVHWELEIDRVHDWIGPHWQAVIDRAAFVRPLGTPQGWHYYNGMGWVRFSIPRNRLVPQGTTINFINTHGGGELRYALNGDPRAYGGAFSADGIVGTSHVLQGNSVEITARVLDNGEWSPATPHRIYLEQDWHNIAVSEIHYHPTLDCNGGGNTNAGELAFLELHNHGTSPVDLSGCQFDDGVFHHFPMGSVIAPGGYLVLAENARVFAATHGFAPAGQYSGKLSKSGETLRLVNPVGDPILSLTYNDRGGWPEAADGAGPSLQRHVLSGGAENPYNWFASQSACGTPGAPNDTCFTIGPVLTEIMYHPENNKPASLDCGEWIELYNPTASALDLSGWRVLHNQNEWIFPVGSIIPGQSYVVAVSNAATFARAYPAIPQIELSGLKLDNGGGRIELRNPLGCVGDFVAYDDEAPWPVEADGPGPSLQLASPDLDNRVAANWDDSGNFGGSPGMANPPVSCIFPPAPLVISEIQYNGPGGDWIELYNNGGTTIPLDGWLLATDLSVSELGGSIAAGDTLVIAQSGAAFQSAFPGIDHGTLSSLVLDNGGGAVAVLTPERCLADFVAMDDNVPWPVSADGAGSSLTLLDPASDNQFAWNWSGAAPSPGSIAIQPSCVPPSPPIVINELNVDSSPAADVGDWVELYNPNDQLVDLSGWNFYDQNGRFTFPASSFIAPRSYLVLAENPFAFLVAFPGLSVVNGQGFTLSGGGEPIALVRGNCVVDALVYDNAGTWPSAGLGFGSTLSLLDSTADNAVGSSWTTFPEGQGTPGAPNGTPTCTDPETDIWIDALSADGPGEDWLELLNRSGGTVDLTGYQLGDAGGSLHMLSNLVLTAGERVRLVETQFGFGLNATNETVTLYSPRHCIIDTVRVTAQGINHAPRFEGPASFTVLQGEPLSVTLSASDPDGGFVFYQLAAAAPANLSLSSSGQLAWTPTSPGTTVLSVELLDNDTPEIVSTQPVMITVFPATPPDLDLAHYERTGNLAWPSQAGRSYVLEHCDRLENDLWAHLHTLTATSTWTEFTDPQAGSARRRVYRLRFGP